MRVKTVLRKLLGLCPVVVIGDWELVDGEWDGARPGLVVRVRTKAGRRGRCGRCGTVASWFDRGDGERRARFMCSAQRNGRR